LDENSTATPTALACRCPTAPVTSSAARRSPVIGS